MKTKMTESELDLLGIVYLGSQLRPKRYLVPCVGEVDLYESTTVKDILEMIWNAGRDYGEIQGKKLKVNEIKRVLDIED